jgi:predicted TIM-barrel fold metal-dependent hydrolase
MRRAWVLLLVWAVAACNREASAGKPPPPLERVDVHLHVDPQLLEIVARLGVNVGVHRWVNLSGGSLAEGLQEALAAATPYGGRFLTCTNLDWDLMEFSNFGERMAAELDEAARLGAVCLKIPKALGLGVPDNTGHVLGVDDARLDVVWKAAARHHFPVFIHVADPKAFWLPLDKRNERYDELVLHPRWSFADAKYPRRETLLQQFENLLRRNPDTTFVGVHFGNDPEDVAATDRRMEMFKNLWIDTAARVGEIGRTPPEKLRAFFIKHQDRVLFGTDLGITQGGMMLGSTDDKEPTFKEAYRFFALHWRFFETADRDIPHPTPIQGRWNVNAINLPPDVLRKFYRDNAVKLLRWPALLPMKPLPPIPPDL